MQAGPMVLVWVTNMVCLGSQPPEIREMAARIAPQVRIADDVDFFAAWDLDYAGMEAVKAAVDGADYARAKVELKAHFLQRREPRWRNNHWEMPAAPRGKASTHSLYKKAEEACAHRFRDWHFGGCYDRFGRAKAFDLATHRRDVCFVKDSYWIISDRLEAKGRHRYSQLFHFEPDRTVEVMGERQAGTADVGRANVVLVQADPVEARVIKGRKEPIQG